LQLIPSLKHFGNKIIAMTGNSQSTLAKNADITISIKIEKEVCPNNLAPTTSTTATLVMGDALAIALIYLRDFQPHQFALYHPGGSLGKKLLTKVADVMHTKNLPFVMPTDSMHDVILTMTNSTLGLAIVQSNGVLEGIITDGDLRRSLMEYTDYKTLSATDMMTIIPITISQEQMLAQAEEIMRENHIKNVLVVDDNNNNSVVGVLEYFQS
jgi:arabinose-5-phosphate isomerase